MIVNNNNNNLFLLLLLLNQIFLNNDYMNLFWKSEFIVCNIQL